MAAESGERFGVLVRRYRLMARLTQEQLAERAGLSHRAVGDLERDAGRAPRLDTVTLLAQALGLDSAAREAFIVAARPETAALNPASGATIPAVSSFRRQGMLPVPLTPLVGRECEETAVTNLLARSRLLTLTGPGGVGKTRLALTVAAGSRATDRDGAWLVELAPLSDPELILSAVSAVLRLHEEPGRPLLQTVTDYLENKQLLLVLDNCEHLVSACAALASTMLGRCPELRILATSREGLGVPGEQLYRVPSLAVPDPVARGSLDDLERVEAVRLFVARARERRADFTLTARNADAVALVCARLDGLPLAIELAAGRVGSLPLEAIAAQLQQSIRLLGGGPRAGAARQQTMQAALDWSWDLLEGSELTLLGRLSVFAGGWVLEAAGPVCGEDGQDAWEVAELLAALVGKSLVVLEEGAESRGRYRLLEPVRQYAAERLAEASEEGRVRERHLAWGVALAEEAAVQLRGPGQGRWLERLEAEHDNLRAALAWSLRGDAAEQGLRLAGALWRFYVIHGHLSEGRRWLSEALAVGNVASVPVAVRADALNGAGSLAYSQGDYPRARVLYEESLALKRELGDKLGIAGALNNLGNVARCQGDYPRARVLYEESLALKQELGDKLGIAGALNNLGNVARCQGDYLRARVLYEESLALDRDLGDKLGIAYALGNLGWVAYRQGEYTRAAALHQECLAIDRELGNKSGIAYALGELGWVAFRQGDYAQAEALHHESLQVSRDLGAQGLVVELLEGLAWMAAACGHSGRATYLGGAAETLREALGTPLAPELRADHEQALQAMRATLGEASFAATWAEGRALPLEEAIALALAANPGT